MARRSKVRQLPAEIRSAIVKLIDQGSLSYEQIAERINGLIADPALRVSKSGVHRFGQQHERVLSEMRLVREMAEAAGRELDDVSGDASRLVIESLQALLFQCRLQLSEEERIDDKAVARLAGATRDLCAAMKSSVDVEVRIRERVARDAADAAAEVATEQGLSTATVDLIKSRILGIAPKGAGNG